MVKYTGRQKLSPYYHRMIQDGRNIWSNSSAQVGPVGQDCVQTAFEHHGGWRFHNLSGWPVPVLGHPHSKKVFLGTQENFFSQWKANFSSHSFVKSMPKEKKSCSLKIIFLGIWRTSFFQDINLRYQQLLQANLCGHVNLCSWCQENKSGPCQIFIAGICMTDVQIHSEKKKKQRAQQSEDVQLCWLTCPCWQPQASEEWELCWRGGRCFQWLSQTHWHFRVTFSGLTGTVEGNNTFGVDNFSKSNNSVTGFPHGDKICGTTSLYQLQCFKMHSLHKNFPSHHLPSFSPSNFQAFGSDPKSILPSGLHNTWKYALLLREYSQVGSKLKFLFCSLTWPLAANCRSKHFWEGGFCVVCS